MELEERYREEHIIFGTYTNDTLRLANYRAHHQGLQHNANTIPYDPKPGQPVTLRVFVSSDLSLKELTCFYTNDGSIPTLDSPQISLMRVRPSWDPLIWAYVRQWGCTLPPQPEGTLVRYRIGGCLPDGTWCFADWPPADSAILAATRRYFGDDTAEVIIPESDVGHTFTYSVDNFSPPAWAKDAVIYQIFVDRFDPGSGREFSVSEDLNDFFGGTLRGVIERLDYIASLGVNTLWLSPIFSSPTHHGYDATDYFSVEPRLGTLDDMRELLAEAHQRDMRVVMDVALNHCSNQHPFFKEALNDVDSPYRQWFYFDETQLNGYRGYFGIDSMPEWDLQNLDVRRYFAEVARFWLEMGVDGFRLDYADGPKPSFWSEFRAECRRVKPDVWLFGEIVMPPNVLSIYQGSLDGSLDFVWAEAVRRTIAYGNAPAKTLADFLDAHQITLGSDFIQPVFLDNHDMDRFLLSTGDNLLRLRIGLALLLTWPHPPVLFYGTEVGLRQVYSCRDPDHGLESSRVPMVWDAEQHDQQIFSDVRDLLHLRRSYPGLLRGEQRTLVADNALWAFTRESQEERFLVVLNLDTMQLQWELPGPVDVLWSAGEVEVRNGKIRFDGLGVVILRSR